MLDWFIFVTLAGFRFDGLVGLQHRHACFFVVVVVSQSLFVTVFVRLFAWLLFALLTMPFSFACALA